ncbi:MAG TPA: RidA family protein [Halanaerobiaceae bacterium]|jgi:2-iminobutanoate/2-iminopropanoate deaminase|nr:RidA family protein [Bacillota bacterium]HHU91854.1 RidA family protein [Halanaerobiaceae bacterium]HOA41451.1 RidA family protein [Halanaerobiales bacterium]HPZ63567.1 RidA family protein [Halanaerobiales bacterium]HQD04797.1 RidA family protein [Halanaerobiales bacterium]
MRSINTEKSPQALGPYSQGVVTGNLIFVSGQIPLDADGKLVSEDIQEQTRQCLRNISHILEEAGSSLDKVIKTTIYLADMDDFPRVNEAYAGFFTDPYPARSCVEVSRLPRDGKIEIEAIAELI